MPLRPLLVASCSSLFLFAACVSSSACECSSYRSHGYQRESLELNGKLQTADFSGGVGYGAQSDDDYGGGGYGSGFRPATMMMFGRPRGSFGFFGFHPRGFGFHSGGFGFHSGGFGMGGGHR
jgi:hypothetical protein